jgi:hypothetical protein
MGNFSRDTFDALKHYVGVRLQQGVPLVDADWNEKDDIRRFEIQAFLKWFVGNGVPDGNEGFRVRALDGGGVGTLVMTANPSGGSSSSVSVNRAASTAADALGFGPDNHTAARAGDSPARLTGDLAEPFPLADGMTLTVGANGLPEVTVTFQAADFAAIGAATAAEVAAVINAAAGDLSADAGAGNDFVISGGDGTPEGAGRCLVDGRDALIEHRLKYTSQPLYDNTDLAVQWGVDPLPLLAPPATSGTIRTDTVYLDVWEREVGPEEDAAHLVHPAIGLPTCVRIRREWAVRVRAGSAAVPSPGDADYAAGHGYYALASLQRRGDDDAVLPLDIRDVRERQLLLPPATLITDLFGASPADYRRGLHRPPISLREGINALLRGEIPATAPRLISEGPTNVQATSAAFEDSQQNIWTFFTSDRTGNQDLYLRRYFAGLQEWGPDEALTTDPADDTEPIAFEDSGGDVWLFWNTDRGAAFPNIWLKRFRAAAGAWDADEEVINAAANDFQQVVMEDANTNLWLVWMSQRVPGKATVWRKRYIRATDTWEADQQLITSAGAAQADQAPQAADVGGTVYVVWVSNRDGGDRIWWSQFDANVNPLGAEQRLDPASTNLQRSPNLLADSLGRVWCFFREEIGTNYQIRYARFDAAAGSWTLGTDVTADSFDNRDPTAVEDGQGNIWVFWRSERTGGEVLLYRIYNTATDTWGPERPATLAPGDYSLQAVFKTAEGAVWVTWTETVGTTRRAYSRQFFPVI